MKKIKKWALRFIATGIFLALLLLTFMLNPTLLYANKTVVGKYSIYHNKPINNRFLDQLEQSNAILKSSELFDADLKMDICFKDGSKYPALIKTVLGKDPLTTFYNKIVVTGDEVNYEGNYILFEGHKINLTESLIHVQVHCLEFNTLGFWHSNPVASHPKWKWEGYPEYIARQKSGNHNLKSDIEKLQQAEKSDTNGWTTLSDNTEIPTRFFKFGLLIQYCMEVKKLNFVQLFADKTDEETVSEQMMLWYNEK
ncbi:MAG: hypothetical protein IPP73_18465 [Chitinophagaceae bacterium]|nr:hypothetical protein [Chitinophagaceae bacterium]